jgi:hypothetical protein
MTVSLTSHCSFTRHPRLEPPPAGRFQSRRSKDRVHDFGLKQSKIMNAIFFKSLERDADEKPASSFSHPAL